MRTRLLLTFLLLASPVFGETWKSDVLDADLAVNVRTPVGGAPKSGYPTVVVLKGIGNGPAYADENMLVIEVTYPAGAKIGKAALAPDILKLRRDLTAKDRALAKDVPVDAARIFIMPEGYALKTDIVFDQQGDRTLAADLMYPIDAKDTPLLIEVTCDNAARMGSGSLLFCHDTLLETGMLSGFAVAMIDHPVKAPYKGVDDLPNNRQTMIKAIKTLRDEGKRLGLSGKIGLMGFSRGATAVVSVAGDRDLVQAALVHGNRFDYTRLLPEDKMTVRFEKAWGPMGEKWVEQSAMHYLTKNSAPMFLSTSDTESPEYQLGLKQLDEKLTELGVEHVYVVDRDQRGHRVTTDPERLEQIMAFFRKHLVVGEPTTPR